MTKTARRIDVDVRINTKSANKSAKQAKKKKLPRWFTYSIRHFDVKNPDNIDEELIKHKIDGADVVNITGVQGHHGAYWHRVFYKAKVDR